MNKTKIDWATASWNPVTGCLHSCEYCYARGQVKRFQGRWDGCRNSVAGNGKSCTVILEDEEFFYRTKKGKDTKAPFPFGFAPTLHLSRLDDPQHMSKPQNIFVCSMADLFGKWVPVIWIKAVFEAANQAPQHNYIYLTKNPERYYQLGDGDCLMIPDGGVTGWFGASAATEEQAWEAWQNTNCRWMSLEPIHGELSEEFFWHDALIGDGVFDTVRRWDWIVVGAETGNRKGKVAPERVWIENILKNCREAGTPIFMKDSLSDIWGEPLVQEFPPILQRNVPLCRSE